MSFSSHSVLSRVGVEALASHSQAAISIPLQVAILCWNCQSFETNASSLGNPIEVKVLDAWTNTFPPQGETEGWEFCPLPYGEQWGATVSPISPQVVTFIVLFHQRSKANKTKACPLERTFRKVGHWLYKPTPSLPGKSWKLGASQMTWRCAW